MKRSLLQYMVTCLNMLPSKNGIPSDLIPAEIILESPNTDYKKLKTIFGAYAKVYIDTTSSTKQIKLGENEICQENGWDGNYYMSLATGKQIHAYV